MSLLIVIHNDGTGTEDAANYDVEVKITTSPTTLRLIGTARVEGHRRSDGWKSLVKELAASL